MAQDDDVLANCASRIRNRSDFRDTLFQSQRRFCANRPTGRETHMRHNDVCTSLRQQTSLVRIERIRGREQIQFVGGRNTVDLQLKSHASFLKVGTKGPVNQAHRWKVLNAGKPHVAKFPQKLITQHEGISPANTGEHRRVSDGCDHFPSHLFDNLIGIAIRQ